MAINYGKLPAKMTPRGVLKANLGVSGPLNSDYEALINKPQINGNELFGNKTNAELGIPTELADLTDDETHRTVTDTEKQTWDNKSDFSGSYNDLEDKPDIPDELSDLTDDSTHRLVTDTEKTTWNAKSDFSGSYNDLTDKPTLGTAAAKDYATSVIDGSNDLVTGDAVHEAIDNAVSSSYHHAGTKTCAELVSGLLIKANEGNVYNITDSGVTTADFIEGAGLPIRAGDNVGVAKVSDGVFKFDLLSGIIDTSNFVTKSSTAGLIKNDGSIDPNTYALASSVPAAQIQSDWNQSDNTKLDYIKNKPTLGTASAKNIPSSGNAGSGEVVIGNDTRLTDARNAADVYSWAKAENKPSYSKSEVGLGNVDNTSDTTKKANFTGSIASENTGFVTGGAVYTALGDKVDKVEGKGLSTNDYDNTAKSIVDGVTSALAGKVDKVDGKGLSTNDYTTEEQTKLAGISEGANKVEQSETNGNIVIDGTEIQVYDDTDITDAISDIGENIEDIQDELSTDSATATGNPINFTTKSAQNAVSTIIDLEPIQDLHGYDKPWVGGAGKNLLPMTVAEIKALNTGATWDGNKYTVSRTTFELHSYDGVYVDYIKVSTDSSGASYNINLTLGTFVGENGTNYIINGCPSGGSGSSYNLSLGSYGSDIGSGKAFTYTTNQSAQIWVVQGTIISNKMFYPMIRLASETDPSFAPYSNICPISGRTEIGILGCGRSLWNGEYEIGEYDQTTGEPKSGTAFRTKNKIPVSGNTKYYVKTNIAIRVFYYTDFKYLSNLVVRNGEEFTTPENAVYINFQAGNTLDIDGFCLSKSDSNNGQYTPYVESNDLTISLGQTVYGGTLDVENGVLVVDKAKVDVGTISYTAVSVNGGTMFYSSYNPFPNMKNTSSIIDIANALCEFCIVGEQNDINRGLFVGFSIGPDNSRIRFFDNTVFKDLTGAEFAVAISGYYLCYELETPIIINLTPHEISLLEGVNNISTTGDKITLTYRDGKVATLGDLLEVEKKIPSATAQHNYSTEEQVVGTWIDGKPIYERVFSINDFPNSLASNWLQQYNVKSVKWGYIHYWSSAVEKMSFNFEFKTSDRTWSCTETGWCDFIYLQYTKTTDV